MCITSLTLDYSRDVFRITCTNKNIAIITTIAALYLLWKSHIRQKAKRRRVWVHSTIQRQMSINPALMCVLHFTIVYTH